MEGSESLNRTQSQFARQLTRFHSESQDSLVDYEEDEPRKSMEYELQLLEESVSGDEEALRKVKAMRPSFEDLYAKYHDERAKVLDWEKIHTPGDKIVAYKDLAAPESIAVDDMFGELAVLKLNGGLGTSMGCVGPKSVISVRNDSTFLDLCVKQIEEMNKEHGVDVPLILMNSFNTDDDTHKVIKKFRKAVKIDMFNQSQFPRVLKETLQPLPSDYSDSSEWYPPGHGDLYRSLESSGLLDELLEKKKKWLFISNIDNLGASVDTDILKHIYSMDDECEFVMEVTNKTRADVKGGTLIEYDGAIKLLEVAQVPKKHLEDFKSVNKFKVFNTNNLWVNLQAIKKKLRSGHMEMEVIENKKVLNDGRVIIQLEQAVGAAIQNFKAIGINVPRSRFLPVKKTSDLLLVMSNLYHLTAGELRMSDKRIFKDTPLVKLGDHFKKVKNFLSRFENVPDILGLDHLTVSGDVHFGRDVTLRGTVIIIANEGDRIDIPSGAILENKIVSGNLRILEH
eukprot:m.45072 g.45072  ORF g.45072 m.45072 type:complete len:510 (+) comp10653_c0_seq1:280-1809(+)